MRSCELIIMYFDGDHGVEQRVSRKQVLQRVSIYGSEFFLLESSDV